MTFQVTVHRVVNFVERRSPIPRESDRGFRDDQWYNGPQQYPNTREYHDDGCYPPSDRRYTDDSPYFHRNSPFPRNVRQACYAWFVNYNVCVLFMDRTATAGSLVSVHQEIIFAIKVCQLFKTTISNICKVRVRLSHF